MNTNTLELLELEVLKAVNEGLKNHKSRKDLSILEAKFASIAKRARKLKNQYIELKTILSMNN